MKRKYKTVAWIAGGVAVLAAGAAVWIATDGFNPAFKETKIYPDDSRTGLADTTFIINGVPVKMIGIKGGKIDCEGITETIELDNFYISETEVTQELWNAVMDHNPSSCRRDNSLPVENVSLSECLNFIIRLDSISGQYFDIPTYPEWLYAAYLARYGETSDNIAWHMGNADGMTHPVKQKEPDRLGLYDMLGNVAEWTISGSNPLFFVAGGSFKHEKEKINADFHEFYHADIQDTATGLRLVAYPADSLNK